MSMTKAILRWAVPMCGLLFIGPLAGMCTMALRARDGSGSVTPMLAASPVLGLALGVVSILIAGVFGVIATWINGVKSGFFTTGLILAWATWGTGTMDDIIRRTQSSSTMWKLAGEGVLLGIVALGVAVVLAKVHQRRLASHTPTDAGSRAASESAGVFAVGAGADRKGLLVGLGAALGAMGVVAAVIATETLKGQAFAAAVVAAMVGVIASSFAARSAPIVLGVAAAVLLAAVSPAAATLYHGSEPALLRASLAGSLFPLARLVPLDWLSGAFVGIPLGLSIVGGLTEAHHHSSHT